MPPPFRQPSQPGASAATKKAFKPPARAGSGSGTATGTGASSSPSTSTAARPVQKTVTAGPSKSTPYTMRPNGFQSAAAQIDQEDLEAFIISSEDDGDDDDFSAALTTATATKRATAPSKPPEPASKRQKAAIPAPRLPSLSPMSDDSIPRAASPVQNNDTPAPPAIGGPKDDIPLLPTALITRLLHESFNDKTTKTGKDASALMARYLDVFVREAVARAAEVVKERQMVRDATGEGEDDDDVWLDVKDLEEVAPGMVLDF